MMLSNRSFVKTFWSFFKKSTGAYYCGLQFEMLSASFKPVMIIATLIIVGFNSFPLYAQAGPAVNPLTNSSGKQEERIGNHKAVYDRNGALLPWTSWTDALSREMNWYLQCPLEFGYPRFVWMTFMTGNYLPDPNRTDFIPATQNGMGIISYLKYYTYDPLKNKKLIAWAKYVGDYLVKESCTPDSGAYPRFTRSTGICAKMPQPPDCGTQGDAPYDIQPDKGGIAGYALLLLYKQTKEKIYFEQALHNARVLVQNMRDGDSLHSPWPYRADYRTDVARGDVSSNMTYILRLFDELLGLNYDEFKTPRARLWDWIRNYQIPNASKDGMLWAQFFEDHHRPENRNAWSPLNMVRYLIERKQELDPDWQKHSRELIDFVNRTFTGIRSGVTVCGEQDFDRNPWGGIVSTYGAVLAMYAKATGTNEFKNLARGALNFAIYATDEDGCPGEQASYPCRGGWQEDAHTDKIHNFLDAINAFPEWAE